MHKLSASSSIYKSIKYLVDDEDLEDRFKVRILNYKRILI
jgi:hypothetical protein